MELVQQQVPAIAALTAFTLARAKAARVYLHIQLEVVWQIQTRSMRD
jgi:hypothetical protein